MSNDVWRWVIAIALFAHGIGHILFMPVLSEALRLESTGHSWLLTNVFGEAGTKGLATIVAAIALALFVAAGGGLLGQADWWRAAAVAGAVVSAVLIASVWDGLPTANAFFALVFDAIVLGALLIAGWPSAEAIGA